MNSVMSFLSFGRGAVRENGRLSRQADGPSAVERLCADTLSALERFTEIVEADPTGAASQEERLALRDLNRTLRAASLCRCQTLADLLAKSRIHEAMKVWFPPQDPRMQFFASDLAGEVFRFLERCQNPNKKAVRGGKRKDRGGANIS